jgi:PTS system nitrogen regulatory IIA component
MGANGNKKKIRHPKEYTMRNVLTIDDVAKKLQMSTSTIYKYAENGKIPSIKIGTCRRFIEEEIDRFIISCQQNQINQQK